MGAIKIVRLTGEGQGSCDRCETIVGCNRHWMSMLCHIQGIPEYKGTYCTECAKVIVFEHLADFG